MDERIKNLTFDQKKDLCLTLCDGDYWEDSSGETKWGIVEFPKVANKVSTCTLTFADNGNAAEFIQCVFQMTNVDKVTRCANTIQELKDLYNAYVNNIPREGFYDDMTLDQLVEEVKQFAPMFTLVDKSSVYAHYEYKGDRKEGRIILRSGYGRNGYRVNFDFWDKKESCGCGLSIKNRKQLIENITRYIPSEDYQLTLF